LKIIHYHFFYQRECREAVGRPEFPLINRAEKEPYMKNKEPRKRRKLSGEKKYTLVEELKLSSGSKSEILRREGLFSADIKRFEEIAKQGAIKALNESHPGRRKKRIDVPFDEHERLKRDLERKDMALAELSVEFTILKKKVNGE